ncbi:MAG: MFS transporter [Dehalococcoidales bacterium]|nr:MFS transporter [Dehalococcoidales bacterium]
MTSNSISGPSRPAFPVNKGIILFTTCISLFFLTYQFSAVSIVLPAISEEFQADAILLSWISTAGLLSTGVLLLPIGRLADVFGLKRMFTIGLILYTVLITATAFANSIYMLIVLRVLTGVSSAMAVCSATALIPVAFPPGERGRALGLTSASVYLGLSTGPFLGGLLTEYLGWRSTFLINIPCILFSIILLLWKVKNEWRGSKGEGFDLVGSAIFCASLVAFLYGFSILPRIMGMVLIPVGIIGLLLFIRWEKRVSTPILNLDIFKNNRTFVLSNLSSLVAYAATFAITFLMSLYLQYIKGLRADTAGLVLIAQPAIQAFVSPLAGRLSDKIEPRIVSSIGMTVICAGLIAFAFLGGDSSFIFIVFILLVLGIGFGIFVPPNINAIMSSVAPRYIGTGSAVSNTMRQVGQVISMGTVMIVISVFLGNVVITPEYHPSLITSTRIAFIIFAVLCFGGIFTSLSRGNVHKP